MIRFSALVLLTAVLLGRAHAAEVQVAVAANFSAPMLKIVQAFEQDSGHKAKLAFGSTGKFYAQIKNGAPFHLLLAADVTTPQRLVAEGLGLADSRFSYATGRLVLWSKQPGLVDAQGAVLTKAGAFERIALADPKLAPYGAAAVQALGKLDLLEALMPKFVQGESIAQTYQFIATENAALGFVALSQVQVDGRIAQGSAWIVPATLHDPIRQDALLLKAGLGNPAATALLQYLRSDKSRAIIRAHGYEL
ncbi:molybdate ABC transporter substrate-binding protein [Paucibacter sp. PLA-PC-4]|uniref:molybdate ABC transporter substrate-binding protein n=1 Tax=Paucibacter sp. PLA-PC-4 TaxID=2993655 RepID=UPI002249293C|nr:molybdate ABC transporter substrate-binding protein [Paucibacter sp. PLA-PC-4]MCX2862044.1 molybdate ABC transporter substrate-binding protein [Paucibacter sp. PLA-PC-4]